MKKLISLFLVPFLLLVSGNLFSMEEFFFIKKFSLSGQIEINENHLLPERNHPISTTTSNTVYTHRYGLLNEQSIAESSPSLAEVYLIQLATRSKSHRKIGGLLGLAGGGVLTFVGLNALTEKDQDFLDLNETIGTVFLITGGALFAAGIYTLAVPSGAERKLDKVQSISDLKNRERMCIDSLVSLSKSGRRNRIISGILGSTLAAYILADSLKQGSTDDYYGAAIFGAYAVKDFFWKSPAEKAYRDYLRESEQRKKLGEKRANNLNF